MGANRPPHPPHGRGRVRRAVHPAEAEYAGLYIQTPDSHPVIDRVHGLDGLYVCTGFSGHGFKLSPAVGLLVSELVLDGKASSIDVAPLRMSRFAEGALNLPGYGFRVLV